MKKLVILSLMLFSVSVFSQSTKAVREIIPESAQIIKAKKAAEAHIAAGAGADRGGGGDCAGQPQASRMTAA